MLIYRILILLLIVPYPVCVMYGARKTQAFGQVKGEREQWRILSNYLLAVYFFVLFLMFALRGNFTTDYDNYVTIFRNISQIKISEFFKPELKVLNVEKGFAFLNWLISLVSTDSIWLFVASGIILLIPIFLLCSKSDYPIIATLLYLVIGTYFQSYNVMRTMLASSIAVLSIPYLIKGEFLKYLAVVAIAGLFHTVAFILIPLFFIMRIKPTSFVVLIYFVASVLFVIFLPKLANLYDSAFRGGGFLVSQGNVWISNFKGVLVPISCVIFSTVLFFYNHSFLNIENRTGDLQLNLLHFRHKKDEINEYNAPSKRNDNNAKIPMEERVFFHGTMIWGLFTLGTLVIEYSTRFAAVFLPFTIFQIPLVISKVKDKRIRAIFITAIVLFCLVYYWFWGSYYTQYYLWNQ